MASYPRSICSAWSMRLSPSATRAAMSSAIPARMSGLDMVLGRRRVGPITTAR